MISAVIKSLLLTITLLQATCPCIYPPQDVTLTWISDQAAVMVWFKQSDANEVCIRKEAAGVQVLVTCLYNIPQYSYQALRLPPNQLNDNAIYPNPGDKYFIEERSSDSNNTTIWQKEYGPFILGQKPAPQSQTHLIYFPLVYSTNAGVVVKTP